jgi:hypothetical protein
MTWSLNELEAEVKKAMRGAGLSWGLAEDGSKAVRWLAANGVDPMPALNDILNRHDRRKDITAIITMRAGRWQGEMAMCPIVLGAALCDDANRLLTNPFVAGPVAQPLLLVPFAANAARILKRALRLDLNGIEIVLTERGDSCVEIPSISPDLPAMKCEVFVARLPLSHFKPASMSGIEVDPGSWASLSTYVHRTYVPASERSRREGAGAGLIDND